MNSDNINVGGSFRGKRNPFAQVSNAALRDKNLSLKAKGLYGLIQSYITMPGFVLYKGHLMSCCKEKEKAFHSAWKELKDNGYLKQYRIPKGKNDTFVYEYDLLDVADLSTPSLINLNKNGEIVKTDSENAEPKIENPEPKTENPHTPHLVPYAKSTPCQADAMPKAPCAARGGYSNIDLEEDFLSNTDASHTSVSKSKSTSESLSVSNNTGPVLSTGELSTGAADKTDMTMTLTMDNDTQHVKIYDTKKKLPSTPTPPSKGLNESFLVGTQSSTGDFTTIEKVIQDNIQYEHFLPDINNRELVKNFVSCMVDTLLTDSSATITIGNGKHKETKPISVVKSVFMRIRHEHILHAVDQFKGQRHKITHKIPYMRSLLYNTYLEMDAHYTNQVRVDDLVW